jgi:predicted O-methyltransferase YrrM
MSLIRDNIAPRLRLVRTALFERFIYADLVRQAEDYGLTYRDLGADLEPFEFVRRLVNGSTQAPPDFGALLEPAATFTRPGDPSVFNSEPGVGRFLGQLAFYLRPRTVVELGCFVGWSSAHLALALKAGGGGRLYCVDYMQAYLDTTMANLGRHGLSGLATPVRGMSMDAAVLASLPEKIDLVFIDTSHSYPATRDEILAYERRLAPGGYIALHDSVSASGVRRSVRELADRFHVMTFATEQSNGVTVLRPR